MNGSYFKPLRASEESLFSSFYQHKNRLTPTSHLASATTSADDVTSRQTSSQAPSPALPSDSRSPPFLQQRSILTADNVSAELSPEHQVCGSGS